ncbi:hypothetical protein CEP54_016011 [Fusarium duplospermum]|uniref:Uncharacterized protein n=1 Tax=Fusarium duplospermum TaxID=1325734 RepID=A0A428NJ29_9HYPO|nr:hypothetical protein CEP54_016011 [Fusarium duplospermum]
MATTAIERVPAVSGAHDEKTSAQGIKLSPSEKREFREELRLAGLFGPGDRPLQFDELVEIKRVALIQFHNRLIRRSTTRRDRLEYLDKQQDVREKLANDLSNKEDLGARESVLGEITACTRWLFELLELVEDVRHLM